MVYQLLWVAVSVTVAVDDRLQFYIETLHWAKTA